MHRHKTFARIVATPEQLSALQAVRDLAEALAARGPANGPLMLHGPPGTGKSLLAKTLIQEATRQRQDLIVCEMSARDFKEALPANNASDDADMLVVEDLHHLPLFAVNTLVQMIDDGSAQGKGMLFTARMGPRHLGHDGALLPARLTSRLAAGLVIAMEPLQAASRLLLLKELSQRKQLAAPSAILEWLAQHLTGGGRQLEGAISQLGVLSKLHGGPLTLKEVSEHFQSQIDAGKPSPERIAQHVSAYFRVDSRQLASSRRQRGIVWPRQVGMYLTRQLTDLSLERIGAFFGGRDHTTVLHACRKVEEATRSDAVLAGAVQQIQAELA